MAEFSALVEKYKHRKKDALIDSVTAGLSYADNVAVSLGLMEDSGIIDAPIERRPLPSLLRCISETGKPSRTRVTVLDDYQSVAHSMAGWRDTGHELEVTFVPTHIADDDELLDLLKDTDIVVAMRERTPLRAGLIARLPRLELIVTTGMQNASIDMDAGPMVCGTPSLTSPTAELTWALITGLMRNVPAEAASPLLQTLGCKPFFPKKGGSFSWVS